MTKHYLDIHILQSLPPSNANRDDDGRPKTATFGGTMRARVSSQAWKRAVRKTFKELAPQEDLAVRTLRVVEALTPLIQQRRPDWAQDEIDKRAAEVFKALGLKLNEPRTKGNGVDVATTAKYLVFLSHHQLELLADLAAEDGQIDTRKAKAAADSRHGIEVSLFGRMVADATDLNVDSAVQVAHALSTHAVDRESDYFTAVDDFKQDGDDAGAGMIGFVDFNSSTLYRFATIDLSQLHDSVGDAKAAARAARAFVEGFAMAMPTGKQNTFANNTVPDAVLVQLRKGRSASFVNAFEEAVPRGDAGYMRMSAERLAAYAVDLQEQFLGEPERAFLTRSATTASALERLAPASPLPRLLDDVEQSAAEVMAG